MARAHATPSESKLGWHSQLELPLLLEESGDSCRLLDALLSLDRYPLVVDDDEGEEGDEGESLRLGFSGTFSVTFSGAFSGAFSQHA